MKELNVLKVLKMPGLISNVECDDFSFQNNVTELDSQRSMSAFWAAAP